MAGNYLKRFYVRTKFEKSLGWDHNMIRKGECLWAKIHIIAATTVIPLSHGRGGHLICETTGTRKQE